MQTKPFDLGQVYSTGEAIKAQRIQNQQAPMRNAMLQQQLDNARQSNQIAQNQEQRARTEFGQKQTEFDNKQQIENTKLLHMAMTEIASNPDSAQRYIPMLSERGIMDGSKLDFTVMTPEALQAGAREVAESTGQALRAYDPTGFGKTNQPSFSANTEIFPDGSYFQTNNRGESFYYLPSGELETDPQKRAQGIENAYQLKQQRKQQQADMEVDKQRRIEDQKLYAKRRSDLIAEYSAEARSATKSKSIIASALSAARRAQQGAPGAIKTFAAKFFPGIDISNEAQLEQAFTQLALEQLQSFKGPTTDFEYNVAKSVGGTISDPVSANIARLKAIDRARWFTERRVKQFQDYLKNGGDLDTYTFNFDETIKTRIGEVSLFDLMETAQANHRTIEEQINAFNGK